MYMCRTYNGFDINSIESYRKNVRSVIDTGTPYDDVVSGAIKDSRGNICPTTIILPTLAMQTKEKLDKQIKKGLVVENYEETLVGEFLKLLDKKIHEAKDSLLERFDWISSQPAASAKFMYENGTMGGYVKEEGIKSALRHGTIVIGQLGLAETLHILIGENQTTKKGMELAKTIEKLYNERCAEFKKEYKMNFGNYLTPAENLCFTAMKKFKAKYGEIEHVSDHDYFTNSIHVPVWEKMTPFEKIDIESQLAPFSNAGCITYVELDASAKNNIQAIEELVNYAMDKDIPYFAINVPSTSCCSCGYIDADMDNSCPVCGSTDLFSVKRVTGYLTGDWKKTFNFGKQAEAKDRVKHTCVDA